MDEKVAINQWRQEFAESLKPILSKVDDAINFKRGSNTSRDRRSYTLTSRFTETTKRPASARRVPSPFDATNASRRLGIAELLRVPLSAKSKTAPIPTSRSKNLGDTTSAAPLLSRRRGESLARSHILSSRIITELKPVNTKSSSFFENSFSARRRVYYATVRREFGLSAVHTLVSAPSHIRSSDD